MEPKWLQKSIQNSIKGRMPPGMDVGWDVDGFRKSSVIYSSIASSMFLLSESELSTCTLEFCDPRRILAISQKVAISFFPYITLSFKFASQTSREFFHFLSDDCALRITSYILCCHAIIFNVHTYKVQTYVSISLILDAIGCRYQKCLL